MKDLIKNYKNIIRGLPDSDSEYESQPLVSSSNSSSVRSFGTVFKLSDSESDYDVKSDQYQNSNSMSPVYIVNKTTPKIYDISKNISPGEIYNNELALYHATYIDLEKSNPLYSLSQGDHHPRKISTIYNDCVHPENTNKEQETSKNPSIVTIFAVWNTMLGSSLLAISWGIDKTGLFWGIIINLLIGAICLYTANLLLKVNRKHSVLGTRCEVPELCKMLLGTWAEILTKSFSLLVLVGANIVYWILMSNFLFNLVGSVYGFMYDNDSERNVSVICPKENFFNASITQTKDNSVMSRFETYWDLYSTVPFVLGLVLFPILNFKDASIFLKFNSLGTVSVVYLIGFTMIKSFSWGAHLPDVSVVFQLKPTFVALNGMLSLSYFIHNIIISIMSNNRHQEKNGRDMTIAFGLVTFTYTFIGGLFYISFPLAKFCIEDNFFNNFSKYDMLVIIGRLLLLFQLMTVFPLLCFMLRKDIFSILSMFVKSLNNENFQYYRVLILNFVVVVICICFACFMPHIGTIIRYTGALTGLVYVYMIPNLLNIYSLKKENKLTTYRIVFHVFIIVLGVCNLLSQFLISD